MRKKQPVTRFTYDGRSIYWTIYDRGERVATCMTEKDAKSVQELLQSLDDKITLLQKAAQ